MAAQVQEDQGIIVEENEIVNDEIQKITGKITTEVDINVQVQEEQTFNEQHEIIQSETKVISGQVEIEQSAISSVEQVEKVEQKEEVSLEKVIAQENISETVQIENTNQSELNINDTTVAG